MIKIDFNNILATRIGPKHGLTETQLSGALRKYSSLPNKLQQERQQGQHHFMNLPYLNQTKITSFARQMAKRFENVVVLGVGGSALGTIALHQSLHQPFYNLLTPKNRNNFPRLFVLDNVDPDETKALFDLINPKKTIFNVISKSGSTTETIADLLITLDLLKKSVGHNYQKHFVVTTGQKGFLRNWAKQNGLTTFEVPAGVGGRYSVLSPVGLLPLALTGIPIDRLLSGARKTDRLCQSHNPGKNPAWVAAMVNFLMATKKYKPITVMMPYAFALKGIADWFRQLWAESLGKRYNRSGQEVFSGPTPINALGVTDQHSQLQLYTEGPYDKLITFIEVKRFRSTVKLPNLLPRETTASFLGNRSLNQLINAEKKGTELSLVKARRPNYTILIKDLSVETIGGLLYFFELMTAYTGKLYNINPYDQPGVEDGKKLTFALMGKKGYAREKEILKNVTSAKKCWIIP